MSLFTPIDDRSESQPPAVITQEGIKHTNEDRLQSLPLVITKQIVLFPGVIIPINLQQQSIIRLAKKIHEIGGFIGVIAQKRTTTKKPTAQDIFSVGTIGKIMKIIILPDGNTLAILQGQQKFQAEKIIQEGHIFWANMHIIQEQVSNTRNKEVKALIKSIKEVATKIIALQPEFPTGTQLALDNIQELNALIYFLASSLETDVEHKQKLLVTYDSTERGNLLLKYLLKELEVAQLSRKLQEKVHQDINQQQRDHYIRHQIKVLQDELGENDIDPEIKELRTKGTTKNWPKDVSAHFYTQLDKAERLSPNSPDYAVIINHAELLLDLPWGEYTQDNMNLEEAAKILDTDHYGIEKVKERLLEYLAVLQRNQNMKGPILCLCGPPGVGKTSLGKSIAKALHRKYTRISLGGLHDEAEIRGHRRTYIGAMPGKLIKNIQRGGSSNPVLVLDEIDKLSDWRGDPAAALLEALDPEQNNAFIDNFLEVPYDLSKVLFITTANALHPIPPALKDRLEVIELTSYTAEEKLHIARKHLFPKQRKEHRLQASELGIYDSAIVKIIEHYTREAGVRELERKLGSLVRKVTKAIALGESYPAKIKKIDINKFLGTEQFDQEAYQHITLPGIAIGLAWTPVGGEILFVESTLSPGKGKITLSGQLGEVMQESAVTALTYLKANAASLDLNPQIFSNYDLHIHVPAGAVAKDGPSAGITLLTALASLYTQRKVKNRLAMTGEITLRGKVLPVGGIKEKILAAKRSGIQAIILSVENKKDVQEIKQTHIKDLVLYYTHNVKDVLEWALHKQKIKNAKQWNIVRERKKTSSYTGRVS